MKKIYLPLLLLCLLTVSTTMAQITCDSVSVIIDDNFDDFAEGALGPQSDHWTTWSGTEGGDEDGLVSSEFFLSASNSLKIEGASGGGPQDVILQLGNKTSGMYILSWQMLVLDGQGAYYNIQHSEVPGDLEEWGNEVQFGTDGIASLNAGEEGVKTVPYIYDDWFRVRYIIDLDNDVTYLWIGNKFVYSWPFSWQIASMSGTKQLGGVDFYPRDESDWFYVDDVYFAEIPAADAGKYCHTAITIDVGTQTVSSIDCFGAGFTVRDAGQGQAGAWYSYTPAEDGIMTVSSCGGGGDTRVWVFSGGCGDLNNEGSNDDLCGIEMDGAQEWASKREVLVTAGEEYLIVWDDIWEGSGFDFELQFSTDAPVDGNFCEVAIAIEPGIYTIEEINGLAAVSGPNINHTGASTTNYAQSEWYAYTPEEEGSITISSCEMTTEDTRLWVYTGECGISNLELVANSDDDCSFQSLVEDMDIVVGTTYYIEWDSETLNAPGFDWELTFNPVVNVSEAEFTSAFEVSPNPTSGVVFVKYQFSEATDLNINLFNNLGQKIDSQNLGIVYSGNEQLDLSALSKGLYFIVLTDGINTFSQKLIVE